VINGRITAASPFGKPSGRPLEHLGNAVRMGNSTFALRKTAPTGRSLLSSQISQTDRYNIGSFTIRSFSDQFLGQRGSYELNSVSNNRLLHIPRETLTVYEMMTVRAGDAAGSHQKSNSRDITFWRVYSLNSICVLKKTQQCIEARDVRLQEHSESAWTKSSSDDVVSPVVTAGFLTIRYVP
jgi:hypothetical protein